MSKPTLQAIRQIVADAKKAATWGNQLHEDTMLYRIGAVLGEEPGVHFRPYMVCLDGHDLRSVDRIARAVQAVL